MKHPVRCENADPKGVCTCSCGGQKHGILRSEGGNKYIRTININLGGEVTKTIEELEHKKLHCTCGKKFTLNHFLGYPHANGLIDGHGHKWWLFVECPQCKYQWSWQKVIHRIKKVD